MHLNFPLLENGANGNYLHVVCGSYVPGTVSIKIIHYLGTDTAKGFSKGGGEKLNNLQRSLLLSSQFWLESKLLGALQTLSQPPLVLRMIQRLTGIKGSFWKAKIHVAE